MAPAAAPAFRKSSKNKSTNNNNEAVLVTGPRVTTSADSNNYNNDDSESSMAVVESEICQNVDTTTIGSTTTNHSSSSSSSSSPFRRLLALANNMQRQRQDGGGRVTTTGDEQEMEEIDYCLRPEEEGRSSVVEQQAVVPSSSTPLHHNNNKNDNKREADNEVVVVAENNNYDVCREYSYDSDDELCQHYFNNYHNASNSLSSKQKQQQQSLQGCSEQLSATCYVLGKVYHPIHDYDARRDDENSLFWFTYRSDFITIEPYNISTDAGWGCMLRALQMLTAQALRLHYKTRDWRPPSHPTSSLFQRRQDPFVRSIMTWFADFPSSSTTESVYSLHNMVAAGLAKYDKFPGEWYGPGTACYVLRDLVEMHQKRNPQIFRVHVAAGGTVYKDAVDETMTRDTRQRREKEREETIQKQLPPPAHPLDVTAWEQVDSSEAAAAARTDDNAAWDTALLLLIPLRLGLRSFNRDYVQSLAHTFSLPQSVGVLGGKPRGARWFYGALADGDKILGLDPHTVQPAPKRRPARVNGQSRSVIELSDEYLRSIHTTYPEVSSLVKLDPSIALGFYCRNRDDLELVFASLERWKKEHPDKPEIFAVADKAPDYAAASGSSALDAMLGDSCLMEDEDNNGPNRTEIENGDSSDEDEFVFL